MYRDILLTLMLSLGLMAACTAKPALEVALADPTPRAEHLVAVAQIDSFHIATACRQALAVVQNNPYDQDLFEKVFARIIVQSSDSAASTNADIIWEEFVVPLRQSGKVPSDLAVYLWNGYFSKQFVSLPEEAPIRRQCFRLPEIKRNLEKEYALKRAGFQVSRQGDPDSHFLNAMFVYNTMWALCHAE